MRAWSSLLLVCGPRLHRWSGRAVAGAARDPGSRDAGMACGALPGVLVRACPVVPLAAGCRDESGKHAGAPHGRHSCEQR